jgi:8-oxo-dGTP pyrophosphatase MutT (NUDIX family)
MDDEAIPAATLIVVRDQTSGPPQLLVVERASTMAFAAGALVFPGGRVDEQDHRLGSQLGADGAAVAAIRETIEETAIPVALDPTPGQEAAEDMQRRLWADTSLEAILTGNRMTLAIDALTPFARWVPKFHAVRRFDTLFYVARSPKGDWSPRVIEGECAGAHWLTAAEVLERDARGEARLIFPTRRNFERLAQHDSFAAIRADALAHPIEPITPWVEEVGGAAFVTIPEGLGYPVRREKLEGLWRG